MGGEYVSLIKSMPRADRKPAAHDSTNQKVNMPASNTSPASDCDDTRPALPPAPAAFTQTVRTERCPNGWTETEIRTLNRYGQAENETTIRSRLGWKFIDISTTEYVGIKRRAKLTSVRLEDEGARALLAICRALFGDEAAR